MRLLLLFNIIPCYNYTLLPPMYGLFYDVSKKLFSLMPDFILLLLSNHFPRRFFMGSKLWIQVSSQVSPILKFASFCFITTFQFPKDFKSGSFVVVSQDFWDPICTCFAIFQLIVDDGVDSANNTYTKHYSCLDSQLFFFFDLLE